MITHQKGNRAASDLLRHNPNPSESPRGPPETRFAQPKLCFIHLQKREPERFSPPRKAKWAHTLPHNLDAQPKVGDGKRSETFAFQEFSIQGVCWGSHQKHSVSISETGRKNRLTFPTHSAPHAEGGKQSTEARSLNGHHTSPAKTVETLRSQNPHRRRKERARRHPKARLVSELSRYIVFQ